MKLAVVAGVIAFILLLCWRNIVTSHKAPVTLWRALADILLSSLAATLIAGAAYIVLTKVDLF